MFQFARAAWSRRNPSPWNSIAPVRDELFGEERLMQHARSLAGAQSILKQTRACPSLTARLKDNARQLLRAYETTVTAAGNGEPITPAAEWLLDNYHLVEDQVRQIRDDLPASYYRQLPKLSAGSFSCYPRVFGLAWAFVAHTDSHFDPNLLCRFVEAYQTVQPLTIGELWAVAITLRIVLIENLRRLADEITDGRIARVDADAMADRLLGVAGHAPQAIETLLVRYGRSALRDTFAVQLIQRLHDQDPEAMPAIAWLHARLIAQNTTVEQIVAAVHQNQGAASLTVRNVITSMRLISDVDWSDLFERMSPVDERLRVYPQFVDMDFATRNLYRGAIEVLARGSSLSEIDIADRAVAAAQTATQDTAAKESAAQAMRQHTVDPGYYLLGAGRHAFETAIGYRPPARLWLHRFTRRVGLGGYIARILLLAALLLGGILALLAGFVPHAGWLVWLGLAGILPTLDAAVAIANRGVMRDVNAVVLPGLALRDGVPAEMRTVVAVPTLLTTRAALTEQIERLEIHHLASGAGEIYYALLSDWTDSPTELTDDDQGLLAAAAAGIAELNRRYPATPHGARFLLLHRRRIWNQEQRHWMGWERKRGKLHELNRLLRGATDTSFVAIDGHTPITPPQVRYVITLDADTRLPRDTVRRLIGKMAHPLNRPVFDPQSQRVVEGYGVLQPRVTPSLPLGAEGSLFQRILSSPSGIDPYAAAVSDVYQDLFDEGSYVGKGIYDIDAFELALAGRVPNNTMLSHDLFEGIFARAGLASDIEVVEAFPDRYDVAMARQHRWARGDWQLLPWLFPVRQRAALTLQATGRWKILDNLRRTLAAPATFLALLVGWAFPLPCALLWSIYVVATIGVPAMLPVLGAFMPHWRRAHVKMTFGSLLRTWLTDFYLALVRTGFSIVFLAQQAWSMCDAISRTLFRVLISHRHLLEWTTAAETGANERRSLDALFFWMRGGVMLALFGTTASAWMAWHLGNGGAWVGIPFVIAWLASPVIAHRVSIAPRSACDLNIDSDDALHLRLYARRNWRYFETFVTTDEHMLPPDNLQEEPRQIVAHRTSPTNVGLYLLATVSAREFGWLGTHDAIARLETTFATLQSLPRHRGHFYNWYDTQSLQALEPRYVSSVDSGNLAGHLIAVGNACRAWAQQPAGAASSAFSGIRDSLALLSMSVSAHAARHSRTLLHDEFDQASGALQAALAVDGPARVPGACTPASEIGPARSAAEPMPTWSRIKLLAATVADIAHALVDEVHQNSADVGGEVLFWIGALERVVHGHCCDDDRVPESASLAARLNAIADTALQMSDAMEFGFLLDPVRGLLSIGYAVGDGRLDPSSYDMLASEARLASFIAIAKGDIPARHWFRLGRVATPVPGGAALVSWSGSMFEYLMPSLVMRAPAESLIARTNSLVVRRQIRYGAALGLPWGISESAFNARDLEFTYQYSSFGIPDLGLKRGLGHDIVIAPYATALAAMVAPGAAVSNFERIVAAGGIGRFGFYEALDYTPARVPEGQRVAVVRAFMAHHQGMSIVAIANALLNGRLRGFFHAEPAIQATELLLQERMPSRVAVAHLRVDEERVDVAMRGTGPAVARRLFSADGPLPATHLLSNGRYTVMLTAAGSGYSRRGNVAVTRWREDATCDDSGSYLYLRDAESGELWSATWQPIGAVPDRYEVKFMEDRAQFLRQDGTLTTTFDVVVSPEEDAEVRRVSLTNEGARVRVIEFTSYAEIVLAPPAADQSHPSFSKLFVETEFLPGSNAILATRRRREVGEPEVWAAHLAQISGDAVGAVEIETDRARFIGRGKSVRLPQGLASGRRLGNSAGVVLDAVFVLRQRLCIRPGETASVDFWTIVADSRTQLLDLVDKHRDGEPFARAAMLAWTQAQIQLRHIGVSPDEACLFQQMAGHLLYNDASLRPASAALLRGTAAVQAAGGIGAAPLWAHGVSGDLPILLVRIDDVEHMALVRQLVHAHEYWRMKRFAVDLVIINERVMSYAQELQAALETLVRSRQVQPAPIGAVHGDIFVLRADLMSDASLALFPVAARAVLAARNGRLLEQLRRLTNFRPATPLRLVSPSAQAYPPRPVLAAGLAPAAALECFNGLGGFANGGREYVTVLASGQCTPMPWVNIVANPSCGFLVSAEGSGYTWASNSRDHPLTPWSSDAVVDPPAEVFYVRDDETGVLWGPQANPMRRNPQGAASYVARHGQGYSRFTHTAEEVALELLQFVPREDPVKISRLVLRNLSSRTRRLSVTAYAEWALGASRSIAAPHTVSEIDAQTGAMFASNARAGVYRGRVAFADLAGRQSAWSADRREFIGRNGSLANPAGLGSVPLSGRVGAGLDPCAALQTEIELAPGGAAEIVFLLGEAQAPEAARQLIVRYREADLDAVLAEVTAFWDETLETVQVATPDRTMDVLLNRWLLYQTLASRIWARAGFYQASGAYGFRDQLQDGMALAVARPELTREHLLRAAARQFQEGDVQHWWLPDDGAGVRTHISDDRAWLAYTAAQYIEVTGDNAILDVMVPFIEGPPLAAGEHDAYFTPRVSQTSVPLFEHCARALDQSLGLFGAHGLPLMGTGDWNDGMNRVGAAGRGESVWLGWFLYATLLAFEPLARSRADSERADRWLLRVEALREALESAGWDGQWYRRGYYDDGTPLGSAANDECAIDAIAQSWSVLSGAADASRAECAMAALDDRLIRRDEGLALLFDPPFDHGQADPGYIKGYPPGIRENGGQYTHAAVWSMLAFAKMGDGDRAAHLFSLLNPINRSFTRSGMNRYKVEPYVMAADVYSVDPHAGRGGWTWYTGSAGWMYRAGIEGLLGLRKRGAQLSIDPCIPRIWPGFTAVLRHGAARYEITVENPQGVNRGVSRIVMDGIEFESGKTAVPLVDDAARHRVTVTLGRP
ncbi:GH36-type glycosyl hydrolase domain-containing protein [Bordetella sp. FB-8]|uniref:GH36-type glycosyl hydrolase domain-containing protein n=1 Tax=Bordetella sp. FB-8 TaxID=1159870 RepID=UPI00052552B9|nr:glucoamylase family protein [Bordetella sp. FB-8]